MTEHATIVGYEPSPHYSHGWLQIIVQMHSTGETRRCGQVPAEGTRIGALNEPAPAPHPIGTVIQL